MVGFEPTTSCSQSTRATRLRHTPPGRSYPPFEHRSHPPGGAGTVRDSMLLGGAVLAERPAAGWLPRGLEDRVVAETPSPRRPHRDPAPGRAAPGEDIDGPSATGDRLRHRQREDADVARTAALRGQATEGGEQLLVVLGVGRGLAGEPPGPDAGPAVEGIDLEARIVCQGGQPGRPGRESRLDPGVRLECQAVLDRIAEYADLVERDEVEVVESLAGEELPELAQLVGRARRDDEPAAARRGWDQRRTVASAAACASNSRARPDWARSRSASTRARSNGLPSAVPWSST